MTARAGLTARLFCCLAIKYRDLTVIAKYKKNQVHGPHGDYHHDDHHYEVSQHDSEDLVMILITMSWYMVMFSESD